MAKAQIVDFSGVKDGGAFNRKRIKAGDYAAKIVKVEDAEAKDGVFQYLFTIKLVNLPSSVFPYYCKMQENQLWKLRNLLIAGGKAVPKKRTKVDPNVLVGKTIGVTIEDGEWEGKEQSDISGVFPAAELDDDDAVSDVDDESSEDEAEDEESEDLDLDAGDDAEEEPEAEEAEEEVEDEEPEAEEEAEEGDEWDAITDRLELRKALKKVAPDVKTSTTMTEDDIRDLIREHSKAAAPAVAKKPAAKAAPARKPAAKKPAAEITDDELEELDIDNI